MHHPLTPEELEQLIHRELRALPARRAPRTLEARVRTALAQQAAQPWYHRSWSYWPATVRAAFLATATGLSGAALTALSFASRTPASAALTQQVDAGFQGFTRLVGAGQWLGKFATHLLTGIPPLWLYGGLTAVVACYVMCFGLGAVAYRTLYQQN